MKARLNKGEVGATEMIGQEPVRSPFLSSPGLIQLAVTLLLQPTSTLLSADRRGWRLLGMEIVVHLHSRQQQQEQVIYLYFFK